MEQHNKFDQDYKSYLDYVKGISKIKTYDELGEAERAIFALRNSMNRGIMSMGIEAVNMLNAQRVALNSRSVVEEYLVETKEEPVEKKKTTSKRKATRKKKSK